MKYKQKKLKIYWTFFWMLIWILGIYVAITKSYKCSSIWIYTSIILHVVSLVSIYIIWDSDNVYKLPNSKLSFSEILERIVFAIVGVIYLFLIWFFSYQFEDKQLSKYGVKNISVVKKELEKYLRKGDGWKRFVKIEYSYNNKSYHQHFRDSDTLFRVGDSIKILHSSKDPELFKLD